LLIHNLLLYTGLFLVAATVIPFIRHDYWIFRVFEYPRLQKLTLSILIFGTLLIYFPPIGFWQTALSICLFINICYLSYLILPYTVFGKKQLISSKNPVNDNNINILIANVYQENKKSKDYHKLIKRYQPDLVLMVETNLWWQKEMDSLSATYPYQILEPLENTYGMLMYSKFPVEGKIHYLVEPDIPSIIAEVSLASGQRVKLFCLHPKPPVPQENPRSTERDKEILLAATMAKESKLPVIVMGDLNDVAWSYTTELFGKISGLLDPRRGRGFFNSFNAKYFFLRFPLDHIFCSANFALKSIKRLERCGSDHFPMGVNLEFAPQVEKFNEHLVPTAEEVETAEEKLNAV